MKNILIINGSPKRKGNTDKVIEALKGIAKNLRIKIYELVLRDLKMTLPDGCTSCANSEPCPNMKDKFEREIISRIPQYDGYIFTTPTHNDNVSVLTKIFIDRIVSFCHPKRLYLKNKKVGIITHGMADKKSWQFPIDYIKRVCGFHKAKFVAFYTFFSDAKPNTEKFKKEDLEKFLRKFKS